MCLKNTQDSKNTARMISIENFRSCHVALPLYNLGLKPGLANKIISTPYDGFGKNPNGQISFASLLTQESPIIFCPFKSF